MSKDNMEEFDDALTDLLICCEKVMESYEEYNLSLDGKENPINKRLQKYIKIYDKSEPSEHTIYFSQIYKANKRAILKGPRVVNWLTGGDITVQFGSELGKRNDFRIHLSVIYNTSLSVRDKVRANLEGLPNMEDNTEILLPNLILYHLYRIFVCVVDKKTDRKRLINFKKDMAREVGIKTGDTSNPMNGLMKYMKDAAKSLGVEVPEDMEIPSGDQISSMLKNFTENPKTKNALGDIMKASQEGKGMGEILKKATDVLGDMAGEDAVKNILGSMAGGSNNDEIKRVIEGKPINQDEFNEDEYLE